MEYWLDLNDGTGPTQVDILEQRLDELEEKLEALLEHLMLEAKFEPERYVIKNDEEEE